MEAESIDKARALARELREVTGAHAWLALCGYTLNLCDEVDALRARLAAAEAEAGRLPTETYYRLDWLVPAENAIGGVAYWHPLEGAERIGDEAEARAALRKAQRAHGAASVRLVCVAEYVEEG